VYYWIFTDLRWSGREPITISLCSSSWRKYMRSRFSESLSTRRWQFNRD